MPWNNPYTSEIYRDERVRDGSIHGGNRLLEKIGSPWRFKICVRVNGMVIGGEWRLPHERDDEEAQVYGYDGKFRVIDDENSFDTLEEACDFFGVPLYPKNKSHKDTFKTGAILELRKHGFTYEEIEVIIGEYCGSF